MLIGVLSGASCPNWLQDIVSFPVQEYASLRNATFLSNSHLGTLAPGAIRPITEVPAAAGGALDLKVSFDLSTVPK